MSMNPILAGAVSYNKGRVQSFDNGATAIRQGDLCKITAGLIVPAAADDENGEFFVALAPSPANGTKAAQQGVLCVPLQDARLKIAYAGSAPTVGLAYGIDDARTLDQTNTTQKLLTVTEVNSTEGWAICQQYLISA